MAEEGEGGNGKCPCPAAIRQQLLDGHFVLPRKLLSSAAPSPAEGRRRRKWLVCSATVVCPAADAAGIGGAATNAGKNPPDGGGGGGGLAKNRPLAAEGDKKYKKSSSEEEEEDRTLLLPPISSVSLKRLSFYIWANYDLSDLLSNSEHLSPPPRSECANRQTVISICIPGGGGNVNRHLPPIYLSPLFSFMPSSSSSCYPAASKFIQHNSCRNVASFAPSLSNSLSLYLFVLPISSWRFWL